MDRAADPLRLALESFRVRHAARFDPRLAVHASSVDPLPHQVSAVYDTLVARRPLRFLLADDPGAGKTIMAGLLVTELRARGALARCVVVAPGSLVDQWRDELATKFDLRFELPERADLRDGAWLAAHPLVVLRLDQIARDRELVARVADAAWDLAIFDEAHRLSTGWNGRRLDPTLRFEFARALAAKARGVLLMSATPHDGSEERFQAFLQLVDADRFEGRYRPGIHAPRIDDLLLRRLKEDLVRFEGTPLFPPRGAATVHFALSPREKALYDDVTRYVSEEFERAEAQGGRGRTVGFALTVLQRRLASSPMAIHRSLAARRAKLAARLAALRGRPAGDDDDDLDDDELETALDLPDADAERAESALAEGATASRTAEELADEVRRLEALEAQSRALLHAKVDRKREAVVGLLASPEMTDGRGRRRKLVVFTEHRDTLEYVRDFLANLRGRAECVVSIDGSMDRPRRLAAQRAFAQDEGVEFLVATDAAGEGINLQCASLVLDWDLPWSPARLEQRFGRVHRIGQTEPCRLFNLVAEGTRETAVFDALCRRLDEESRSLQGQVFDVLGAAFNEKPLRDILLEAVRGGARSADAAAREVGRRVDEAVARQREFSRRTGALADEAARALAATRDDMDRAAARQLGPCCLEPWFRAAVAAVGGRAYRGGERRWRVNHVPAAWRDRDRTLPTRLPSIAFDPSRGAEADDAVRLTAAHPWAHRLADAAREAVRPREGAAEVRVDPFDGGDSAWWLVAVAQSLDDGDGARLDDGAWLVRVDDDGSARALAGPAHLDLRPATDAERDALGPAAPPPWLVAKVDRAVLAPWRDAARAARGRAVDAVEQQVARRLSLELQEAARLGAEAKQRAARGGVKAEQPTDAERALRARLFDRQALLARQRVVAASPARVEAVVRVVPAGALGAAPATASLDARAVEAVAAAERLRGRAVADVRDARAGWDLEARDPATGALRLLVVRGAAPGDAAVTLRRSEALALANAPRQAALVVVEVDEDGPGIPVEVRDPVGEMPDLDAWGVGVPLR